MGSVIFQTEVELPEFEYRTGYRKANLFLGSCFTENVGNKMAALKYNVDNNPFGILYNPVSVAYSLEFLLKNKKFTQDDLVQHDGLWHSFYHHSRFSSPNASEALNNINKRIKYSADFLEKADFLFITFGTAWVYQYKKTGQTVSNCHKIPANEFKRYRLTKGRIVKMYREIVARIKQKNAGVKIIFTVSPIRHWKDGAIENQRSKAELLLAVDELVKEFGPDTLGYFPAYEIVMDELRDYRFYSEDMIHLSEVAVNHIWEKFQSVLIDDESRDISEMVKKIGNTLNHRPFNRFTKEYLHFLKQSLEKTQALQQRYPFLKLALEEHYFFDQINEIEKESGFV